MSNEELIAEARAIAAHSAVSLPEHADYLTRLADALEDAEARAKELETGEWEYGIHYIKDKYVRLVGTLERANDLASARFGDVVVKRRPRRVIDPGTWVPVESEDEL